jgi:glycine hydroxymethyltransferase
MDLRGRVVGTVTSCSIDSEGYQLGQVLVRKDYANEGTSVLVYSNAAHSKAGKQPQELGIGDKATVPEIATIGSRFPKRR